MKRRCRLGHLRAAGAAGVLALLAASAPVAAASSGAPGLRAVHPNPHGYFEYTLGPGRQVADTAVVSNQGDGATDLLVYAADGYTSHVSGIVYGEQDQPLRPAGEEGAGNGAGAWITPFPARLHLGPGASATISFTTAVPAGTSPGDYVGALVAENPTPTSVNGGGLRVTQRSVVAVVVHVPGTVHSGWSIGQPTIQVENGSRQVIQVPLASTGDVLAKPVLRGTLTTCSGTVMEQLDRQLDTFLPHSQIDYPINIQDRVLPAGCYRLDLDFGVPGTALAHADRSLTITPADARVPHFVSPSGASAPTPATLPAGLSPVVIGLLGAAGVVLLGNLLLLVVLLLRRRRRRPETEDERVASGADAGPRR